MFSPEKQAVIHENLKSNFRELRLVSEGVASASHRLFGF